MSGDLAHGFQVPLPDHTRYGEVPEIVQAQPPIDFRPSQRRFPRRF